MNVTWLTFIVTDLDNKKKQLASSICSMSVTVAIKDDNMYEFDIFWCSWHFEPLDIFFHNPCNITMKIYKTY